MVRDFKESIGSSGGSDAEVNFGKCSVTPVNEMFLGLERTFELDMGIGAKAESVIRPKHTLPVVEDGNQF